MVIDFHTHIFPEKIAQKTINALADKSGNVPSTDGTVDGLILAMDRADADICVTLPVMTKPSQFESVTSFVIEVNARFNSLKTRKIISFGGIHPACDDIKGKLKYLSDNGIKGVKIHPDYQNTFIDDAGYIEILKWAKEYDLIVVTHAGVDDAYVGQPVKCPPEKVSKIIDKIGHSKFVLAHFGGHKQWEEVYQLLAGKDVYFDTAFTLHEIQEEQFKKIIEKHGAEKVLFATDCPWRDIKSDLQILRSYNLGKDVEENILYKNAVKLLNI